MDVENVDASSILNIQQSNNNHNGDNSCDQSEMMEVEIGDDPWKRRNRLENIKNNNSIPRQLSKTMSSNLAKSASYARSYAPNPKPKAVRSTGSTGSAAPVFRSNPDFGPPLAQDEKEDESMAVGMLFS